MAFCVELHVPVSQSVRKSVRNEWSSDDVPTVVQRGESGTPAFFAMTFLSLASLNFLPPPPSHYSTTNAVREEEEEDDENKVGSFLNTIWCCSTECASLWPNETSRHTTATSFHSCNNMEEFMISPKRPSNINVCLAMKWNIFSTNRYDVCTSFTFRPAFSLVLTNDDKHEECRYSKLEWLMSMRPRVEIDGSSTVRQVRESVCVLCWLVVNANRYDSLPRTLCGGCVRLVSLSFLYAALGLRALWWMDIWPTDQTVRKT